VPIAHYGEAMLNDYETHLSRLPLSEHTRRNYLVRVKRYLAWLEGTPEGGKALTNGVERDFAVREFKNHLLQTGSSANTVNAILAAVDNLYLYIGLGRARVTRQELPKLAPRSLEPEEQKRFLKAVAMSSSARNRAIALLMIHCGLRVSELVNLNVGDVALTARKRELVIRCGKNSKRRVIPINKEAAEALQPALVERNGCGLESPLFISKTGKRLSQQAVDKLIRQFGRDAGVELSSHSLRHTCLTRLIRLGIDIVTVAEIAGHAKIDTTRRYSLPSPGDLERAMDRLNYGT
jgi:site-specific recombinase XerD